VGRAGPGRAVFDTSSVVSYDVNRVEWFEPGPTVPTQRKQNSTL